MCVHTVTHSVSYTNDHRMKFVVLWITLPYVVGCKLPVLHHLCTLHIAKILQRDVLHIRQAP